LELSKLSENQTCADCDAKDPLWVSINQGVFLCIKCSGIHRLLGVQISRIKSIELDNWDNSHIEFIRVMGNKKGNEILEAQIPLYYKKPSTDIAPEIRENFIRAKYERKEFLRSGVPYVKTDFTKPGSQTFYRNNMAMKELVETEIEYVRSLDAIIRLWKKPLEINRELVEKMEDVEAIFSNIEVIFQINRNLLMQFQEQVVQKEYPDDEYPPIGRILLTLVTPSNIDAYTKYLGDNEKCTKTVHQCTKKCTLCILLQRDIC